MAEKVHKTEKIYYTMGEVAEMFDVNQSLIRFWEQRFDILKPKKNKKGNRLFTPADIRNFELIYHLVKERGMTLAGAEKYLKANREGAEREAEIVRKLTEIRTVLLEIREELKETEAAGGMTEADGAVFPAVAEGMDGTNDGEESEATGSVNGPSGEVTPFFEAQGSVSGTGEDGAVGENAAAFHPWKTDSGQETGEGDFLAAEGVEEGAVLLRGEEDGNALDRDEGYDPEREDGDREEPPSLFTQPTLF